MGEFKNLSKCVVKKELDLIVKENKVEAEFQNDFGSRLRLAKGAILIREIGNKLHCSLITVTKAMVLYHKVRRNPNFNNSCLTSAACLNLSIKLCDENVTPDEIVLVSYHTVMDFDGCPNPTRPDPPSNMLQDMKKKLCLAEYAICGSMSFKLECTIAHVYAYKFLVNLQQSVTDVSSGLMVAVSSTVTKLLCTYYLCEGCLDFTSEEIACASLQFAYLCFGICSPSMKEILEQELASLSNKNRVNQILDELVMVSDVSTTLKYIS